MNASRYGLRLAALGALALSAAGMWLVFMFRIWDLRPDGSSPITRKLPVFDFMNLWSGGALAREGLIDTLFHRASYNGWLTATFGANVEASEWSYPPTMLLLGAPLSALPINAAYVVWTLGTLAGVYFAARALGASRLVALCACVTPAAFVNIWFGQNGALTASLLVGGLALVERRPILAGVLLGLLAMKPQTALIVPFAVVAAGAWRVVVSGALTALATAGLATALFTPHSWVLFFNETQPLMRGILEAPWPQVYQANSSTIFMLMRLAGAPLSAAYAAQAVAAAICAALCVLLWRRRDLDVAAKAMLTVGLAPLMTPYGYIYDLVGAQAAMAVACFRRKLDGVYFAAPVMFWSILQPQYDFWYTVGPIAGLFVVASAALLARWVGQMRVDAPQNARQDASSRAAPGQAAPAPA